MVVIEAAFGACRAFFQPAYTGLIPQTVPESMILDATALTQSSSNLAIMIGPALSTALVLGVGAGEAFLFDAATFVISAALLVRVRARARGGAIVAAPAAPSVLGELRAGWREVVARPWVWVTIAAFTGMVLVLYTQWYALAPLIARDSYGSVGVFGVLESVAGAGAVIGAIVAVRWRPGAPDAAPGCCWCSPWCPVMGDGVRPLHAPLALVDLRSALAISASGSALLDDLVGDGARAAHPLAALRCRASASYDWVGSLALLPVGFCDRRAARERARRADRARASAARSRSCCWRSRSRFCRARPAGTEGALSADQVA